MAGGRLRYFSSPESPSILKAIAKDLRNLIGGGDYLDQSDDRDLGHTLREYRPWSPTWLQLEKLCAPSQSSHFLSPLISAHYQKCQYHLDFINIIWEPTNILEKVTDGSMEVPISKSVHIRALTLTVIIHDFIIYILLTCCIGPIYRHKWPYLVHIIFIINDTFKPGHAKYTKKYSNNHNIQMCTW